MNVAIIAAAGRGERVGGERAKQFLELDGTPIIIHTLRRFEQCAAIQEIFVVLPASETASFLTLASRYRLRKLTRVVAGGASRAESVWRGLQAVRAATAEIVAVHDGVRPFVTPEEISRTVEAAVECGAAILAAPATDTIKEVEGERVLRTFARARLRHALTPQCFRYALLRRAYEEAGEQLLSSADLTDDSALVERLGVSVAAVEGDARNIKITRPSDLALAEIFLKQMSEVGDWTGAATGP
ncbi:MAG TPA: 2-C-methyl-D-erythritol 4-phosphate cytidylyltransferase [Pyrinomonadaceae bacterium]|jgi:2-C-methyl-D-erythritol 4-phosphate cytidylyltransferase|nr:2-C-methyl-D-erythritol 4-phosphate cytidylyltransferase [Pyrinomonadaceae bacterium]